MTAMKTGLPLATFALAAVVSASCGGEDYRAARRNTMRPLEEVRAQRVLEAALADRGLSVELHRRIQLVGPREVEVDVTVGGSRHGIEYVNAQDRQDFGASLPQRNNPNALVVAPGINADQGADLLVLDERDFLYEPDVDLQGPGHPTVQEIEDQLQRCVIDYLTYLRERHQIP
jgi:hypothetical protein